MVQGDGLCFGSLVSQSHCSLIEIRHKTIISLLHNPFVICKLGTVREQKAEYSISLRKKRTDVTTGLPKYRVSQKKSTHV